MGTAAQPSHGDRKTDKSMNSTIFQNEDPMKQSSSPCPTTSIRPYGQVPMALKIPPNPHL